MPEDRRLVPDFTVADNILLPVWATARRDAAERLDRTYGLMPELAPLASGGQRKLVELARALICGSELLLLDEPTEDLAPALARRLGEVLATLRGSGLTVLVAESNEAHLSELLDEVFVIERCTIARRGRM